MRAIVEVNQPVVYLIEAVGLNRVKIGFTKKPVKRYLQIRTSCPVPCQVLTLIPGEMALERELHKQYARRRLCGEWFGMTPEEMDGFSALRFDAWDLWDEFVRACIDAGAHDAYRALESDMFNVFSHIAFSE